MDFASLPKELVVFLSAMTPIGELRLALPLATKVYHMPFLSAYLWSVSGNMVPVVFWVFSLEKISQFLMKKSNFFKKLIERIFEKTRKDHGKKFETFEGIALIVISATPLPGAGGWTGALAAFVFGVPPKKSIPLILIGTIIAGILVGLITQGASALF